MKILLVEDETVMADAVAQTLRRAGHAVDVVNDGASGLVRGETLPYDVVVLDRDLPGVHGDDICRALSTQGLARILMLTASATLTDRVTGLELGADDYLVKPFEPAELVARVDALGRRAVRAVPPVVRIGDLVVDVGARAASRAGRDLGLTPKEFAVLHELVRRPGQPVSAEDLVERVWDEHLDPMSGIVKVLMVGLRRKLGEPGIQTIRGVGYRLVTADGAWTGATDA